MQLPFTHDAFLDVFGRYNTAFWPAALLLWAATAVIGWRWLARGAGSGRALAGLLAAHWAWSGVAYHWFFFRTINPAAALFAAVFLAQAMLFAWLAWRAAALAPAPAGARGVAGAALVIYGLVYPLLGLALGLDYPRLPLFAVPCPTTLVTAGLLLATAGAPRIASVVPFLWAIVGTSAALMLDIHADLALVVAALVLILTIIAPRNSGLTASARSSGRS